VNPEYIQNRTKAELFTTITSLNDGPSIPAKYLCRASTLGSFNLIQALQLFSSFNCPGWTSFTISNFRSVSSEAFSQCLSRTSYPTLYCVNTNV